MIPQNVRAEAEQAIARNPGGADPATLAAELQVDESMIIAVWEDMERAINDEPYAQRDIPGDVFDELVVQKWLAGQMQERRWTPERLEACRQLHAAGLSHREIAARVHTHKDVVSRMLSGRRVLQERPHGTWAGYVRHRRRGEEPCDACRDASRRRSRSSYKRDYTPKPCPQCGKLVVMLARHVEALHTPNPPRQLCTGCGRTYRKLRDHRRKCPNRIRLAA